MLFAFTAAIASQQPTFLSDGAKIEVVADKLRFTEGAVHMPDGSLIFSDIPANKLYQVKSGALSVFRDPSGQANGNTLDGEKRLVTCEHQTRRVTRTESNGDVKVLADTFEGKKLNSPNDVVVTKKGAIYFTDPPYGIQPAQKEQAHNGVYLLKDGKLTLLAPDFDRPNGLVFSPDEKLLYIADTSKGHIRRFSVAADGTLKDGMEWAKTPNPDGLRVDSEGRVWSASGDGVNVFDKDGKVLEVIKFPQVPANLCFSRDGKTLYVTARTAVYQVGVRVKGLAP